MDDQRQKQQKKIQLAYRCCWDQCNQIRNGLGSKKRSLHAQSTTSLQRRQATWETGVVKKKEASSKEEEYRLAGRNQVISKKKRKKEIDTAK